MKMLTTFSYLDIFEGPIPAMEDLLAGLSSEGTLTSLSIINAQLYADNSPTTQLRILSDLLLDDDSAVKNKVINKVAECFTKNPEVSPAFFSIRYSLEFIHYELKNFREGRLINGIKDRLLFFKAYLVISEKINEAHINPQLVEHSDPLHTKLWPILLPQLLIESQISPVTEIPKAIGMLNYFESNPEYKSYHSTFLQKVGKASSWNYVFDITMLIGQGFNSYEQSNRTVHPWIIQNTPQFSSLFELLSIDGSEYRADETLQKAYIGIKDKPLFKIDDYFLVLSWYFLTSKIYKTLVFDFYKLSGISKYHKFSKFLSFKKYVSEEIVERLILRRILQTIFSGRGNVILFDDNDQQGFPDAYVRIGKYIYLFEIKDALFSAEVIQNPSYNSIKDEIDKKFNSDKKGTGQLFKHISYLAASSFEQKSFDQLNIKRRNLIIHPIIIYTDRHFGMPGIANYLAAQLDQRLSERPENPFRTIKPLTMINLSFFIDNIDFITKKKHAFRKILESYQTSLKNRNPSKLKGNPIDKSVMMNQSIEEYFIEKFRVNVNHGNRDYVERIVAAMKLTENLR